MTNNLPIRLRVANQEDVPFLFNSWLKSYRSSFFARTLTSTIYFTEHHKVIERLIKRSNVILAVNDQDPTQIYGFICAETVENIFCLHYIYVKHSFRNLGIAKTLFKALKPDLKETAGVYTHHTKIGDPIAPRYNLLHHPYIYINEQSAEAAEEAQEEVAKEPEETQQ